MKLTKENYMEALRRPKITRWNEEATDKPPYK
jgi:hypothetical protein